MRIRGPAALGRDFGAAVPATTWMPAQLTMRIAEDRGGQIGHYLRPFAMLRLPRARTSSLTGNRSVGLHTLLPRPSTPKSRVCATLTRTLWLFHAAWMPLGLRRPSPARFSGRWARRPSWKSSISLAGETLDQPARRPAAQRCSTWKAATCAASSRCGRKRDAARQCPLRAQLRERLRESSSRANAAKRSPPLFSGTPSPK